MYRPARCLWVTAVFACLVLLAAPQARAGTEAALVTAERGDVECQHGGVGPFLPLHLRAALLPGDVVRTGSDGEAELLFVSDGSSIKVDSRSTLRITLNAPIPVGDSRSLFQVILGVFWAHLRPGSDIEAPGHTNIVTHGTEVLVSVADDGTTTLTVVAGDVSFSNPLGAQELTASQQSIAEPGKAPTSPTAVDPSGLIAWTADVAALPLEFELPSLTPGPNGPPDFTAEASRLETFVQTTPNDAAAWASLGQARRGLGDLTGALAAFAQAETLSPNNTDARVGMALTSLSQGNPAMARAALEPVQGRPMAQAVLGLVDLHEGKAEDAEQSLQAALTQNPQLYQARALLALSFLSRDDLPDAEKSARLAVQAQPDSAQTQGTLAMVLFFDGQPQEAEKAGRRAVHLNPLSPFALLTEGRALLAQQQTDAARTAYEKAAAIAPHLPLVHQELGAVYQQLDMPRKAAEEYGDALKLDPNSTDARAGLGLAYQSQGRYADAESEFHKALQLNPNNTTALYNLASFDIDRGRLDDARRTLERGVRADPQRGILYARLAEISLYHQDLFAAQEFARRAVSLLPDSALTHYELGRVYLEQERTLQAEQEFRQATTLDRQFAAARYALGLTQQKTEAGLISSFSSLLDSASVGSPASGQDVTNFQTPGAEQRIQAALLDPAVVRAASRSYGNTQLDAKIGGEGTRDLAASFLGETPDARGVHGVSAEEQYTNGVRTNADDKIDTASVVLGQKAAGEPSDYLVLGDYQETESGSDNGTASDPYLATQRYHTQLPRLITGVNLQLGGRCRLLALVQGSEARYTRSILMQPDDYDHINTKSLDGELRLETYLSGTSLLTAGFSYGDRNRRDNASNPNFDPTMPPVQVVLTTNVQPYQFYVREDLQSGRHWLLTGQMQVLGLNPHEEADALAINNSQRTTVGLPTGIITYLPDARSTVRLRARRLFATVSDFQLLTPTDVFLLSTSGLPQIDSLFPLADGSSVEGEYDRTFANASFLSLGAFQQDLKQGDILDTSVPVGPYETARIQGVQASYEGLLGRDLSFFLSVAANRSRDTNLHERISQVPDYLGTTTLQYLNRQGLFGQAAYYFQGNRRLEDVDSNFNDDQTRLGGFGLLSLRVGKRTGLRSNVFVELNNVFNRQYDVLGVLQPGRLISAGVSLRF